MSAKRYAVPARCDSPARMIAPNGYMVCTDCFDSHEDRSIRWQDMDDMGPRPHGKCDRPVDGLGAARLSNRPADAGARERVA